MAKPEPPYEHRPAFRRVKGELIEELNRDLRKRLEAVEKHDPYLPDSPKVIAEIDSAGCGHLFHTMRRFWLELLEQAPLSQERRLQLLRRAIDDAYREFVGCGYAGYKSIEEYGDWLRQQDDPERFFSPPNAQGARAAEGGFPKVELAGDMKPGGAEPAQEQPAKVANGAHGGGASWRSIEISFLSDERVQIRNGTDTETRNYGELGFADRRSEKPKLAWVTLRTLAEQRGIIRDAGKTGGDWPKVEKRIQEIRKVLRKHFSITADPIPFVEGTGYQACFKIGCSPSFHT